MSDLSKLSAAVFDHGMFVEMAIRLGRDLGKVYYCTPWESARSKIEHFAIGSGFDEIERVSEIWDVIDKVDVAVFPDVHHGGMQTHLEKIGVPVWGTRRADRLEINKVMFKQLQEKLEMNHAEYEVITGLEALRKYCHGTKDKWIKISPQFRGDTETFHHIDWDHSRSELDDLAVIFGELQEDIIFLVEDPIEAELESGGDFYCIDGQFPSIGVQGYEIKDASYFAAVQKYEDLPEQVREVNEALSPILKQYRYRNFFSTEIKINESGEGFLLEPTCRLPSPAGEEQMELYHNFSEIIVEGANGRLIDPVADMDYACEVMVEHNGDTERYRPITISKEARPWIKLYDLIRISGDRYAVPPGDSCIGAIVGVGKTPKATLEHLKENVAMLEDQPLTIHLEAIVKAIQEIETAQEEGVYFTDKPMPEPAEAIEKS